MSTFQLLVLGDLHLRSQVPPSRISFLSDFTVKWGEVCGLASDQDIDAVIILGDIFNSLNGNVSHGLVSWVIRQFQKSSVPIFVIPGNHDIRLDSEPSHLARRPLGVLVASGVVRLLVEEPVKFKNHFLSGSDKPMTIDRAIENYILHVNHDSSVPSIMCSHGNLIFPGFKCWGSNYHSVKDLDRIGPHQQVHLNGHLHYQQAIYQGKHCLYVSPGSFMRDYDSNNILTDTRPKVALVTWKSGKKPSAELIALKSAKPFIEVFKMEEIEKKKQQGIEMGEFVKLVQDEAGKFSLADDVSEAVGKLDISPVLKEKVQEYLTIAGT